MNFLDSIKERAKSDRKKIVLPEGTDPRVIKAASMIVKEKIADIVLLGDYKEIKNTAGTIDLSGVEIIDICNSESFNQYVLDFCEIRKSKGMTEEQARKQLMDPAYYGAMMVKKGEVDGMVAGAVYSTANTLRPALQIIKTAPGQSMVSGFFIMIVPNCEYGHNGAFVYADSGLCENPTAEELAEIAVASAKSFRVFIQAEPKVAMLSYSTYGSANSELTQKVVKATQLAKLKAPDVKIDGELQLDAAIVPSVGKFKAPGSSVAGEANVFVFPDLNSGNISYKITQRLAKADAYGLITQGLAKPVNDLSRGCSAEDIVGTVALTCIQAQNI